jgi:hypothetical protein
MLAPLAVVAKRIVVAGPLAGVSVTLRGKTVSL